MDRQGGSVVRAVTKFFEDNHLSVKQDWLQSCLEYLIMTNPQASVSEAKEFALEQWKLADLRQIGVPTFPRKNLKNVRVTDLKGNFAVQIEKFWDKANSNYNQYKTLKGEDLDETAADENGDNDLTEWGKGPSAGETKRTLKPRRLLLELCDGLTELKALEWKPIQELSGMVYPGAKMVIMGPVVCRNGIIMLGPEHVKLYGGEVEEILFANSMDNLLATSLGYDPTNDPYTGKTSTLPPPRKPRPQNQSSRSQWQPKQSQSQNKPLVNNVSKPPPAPPNNLQGARTGNNFFNNPTFSGQGGSNHGQQPRQPPKATQPKSDGWDDDMDDFELSAEELREIESVEKKLSQPKKRQTPSPIDLELEEDNLLELERIERQSIAAKRPHLQLQAASVPKAAKSVSVARVPPVQQQVKPQPQRPKPKKNPIQQQPNILNFLSKTRKQVIVPPPKTQKIIQKPFVYLKQLKPVRKKSKRVVIKATVISILRKLSTTNQKWSLLAKITDSTAFLDVELGNKVLVKMIGMKCKDFQELRADRETKTKILQGLKKSLIDCDRLMVVRLSRSKPPKVVKLKAINQTHLQQFRERQRALDAL